MNLIDAAPEKKLKVRNISSESDFKKRLITIGIHKDDFLIKINQSKFGPVLIRNLSSGAAKLALGRGVAVKIIVEYD
ncbi:MAG: Ferrous iron transport protein [Ignavibacteria bacterium]|nr:Ferrous iron transport protein [Ignavibacteria bacterium]